MGDNLIHREGLDEVQIYTDATYTYVCEAAPGAALTAAVWRVRRVKLDGTKVEWAGDTQGYVHLATDAATVAALWS